MLLEFVVSAHSFRSGGKCRNKDFWKFGCDNVNASLLHYWSYKKLGIRNYIIRTFPIPTPTRTPSYNIYCLRSQKLKCKCNSTSEYRNVVIRPSAQHWDARPRPCTCRKPRESIYEMKYVTKIYHSKCNWQMIHKRKQNSSYNHSYVKPYLIYWSWSASMASAGGAPSPTMQQTNKN